MVYFTPVKALTVTLAVAALAADTVQARPAFGGPGAPSSQVEPQARMQKVVLRSSPPPPLPAGVQTSGSTAGSQSRRSFAEQGTYKRSKSKAAASNNRRVFRRSEAGSKRSPSSNVHEHIHIHEHDRHRGSYRGPVVFDGRVRHHSVHWAEHHGLLPYIGKKGRPTLVQIGKKGYTIVRSVAASVPGVDKIVSAFPVKAAIPALAPKPAGKSKSAPKAAPKGGAKGAAKPKGGAKGAGKAAPKPAASKPVGKGKRRHDDRYDDFYYHADHGHYHEHDHSHGHEHVHEHTHVHKRDEIARIAVGDDGHFYRTAPHHEADLLSLNLRSVPDVAVAESVDESGAEVETTTDEGDQEEGTTLAKRRHNDKYYYYDGGYFWDDAPYYYYGKGRGRGNAHIHEHIHSHGGHVRGHRQHGYGYGKGNAHIHEHVHVHRRDLPADTSAVDAKVGGLKADTPLGSVQADDVAGSAGKLAAGKVPAKPDAHAVKQGKKAGKDAVRGKKHSLAAAAKHGAHARPGAAPHAPAPAPAGGPAAGAFVDADRLTHTLAERGLLSGLLKPLLAPLNAIPGFITISDLLFGDDNVVKKVAALVLHAEPARVGANGKVLAARPLFQYSLMSSTDERTQVYLVPAEAPSSGADAGRSFAAAMEGALNGTAPTSGDAGAALAGNDSVVVKIVVPLLNATTGLPATMCATFASKPPSPLELLPCTGAPALTAPAGQNGSSADGAAAAAGAGAASMAVVPEIAGKSQRFQYTPSTGVLSPLYEREVPGVLKQMFGTQPTAAAAAAAAQAQDFHSGTARTAHGDLYDDEDEAEEGEEASPDAEDDDVDFFGNAMGSGSGSGNYARGLGNQLAVDTASTPASFAAEGSEDDDEDVAPVSAEDPNADLNDPAGAGVSGFPASGSAAEDDAGAGSAAPEQDDADEEVAGSTVSPMKANAMAPSNGVGVQLKFVPVGAWAKQMNAAASTAAPSASTTAASTTAAAVTSSTDAAAAAAATTTTTTAAPSTTASAALDAAVPTTDASATASTTAAAADTSAPAMTPAAAAATSSAGAPSSSTAAVSVAGRR